MTPLQVYESEVRFILEWATLITEGIDTYARNQMSTGETS